MSSHNILWYAQDPGGMNAVKPVVDALGARGDRVVDAVNMSGEFKPEILVAGTSIGDSLDKTLLRDFAVPSVYVLDFWNNYRLRFRDILPTKLCVMDELAKNEAVADGIPADNIVVTGNPYFEHFTKGISRRNEKDLVVFISQPILSDATGYDYNECAVLEDILAVLPRSCRLGVRLHPRDEVHKYDRYLDSRVFIIDGTLEEALGRAGLVVGMFSPVLIQSVAIGIPTVSYQPGTSHDPLPINRLGVTRRILNKKELRTSFEMYIKGEWKTPVVDFKQLWPLGAVGRIVAVIDSLL